MGPVSDHWMTTPAIAGSHVKQLLRSVYHLLRTAFSAWWLCSKAFDCVLINLHMGACTETAELLLWFQRLLSPSFTGTLSWWCSIPILDRPGALVDKTLAEASLNFTHHRAIFPSWHHTKIGCLPAIKSHVYVELRLIRDWTWISVLHAGASVLQGWCLYASLPKLQKSPEKVSRTPCPQRPCRSWLRGPSHYWVIPVRC